MPPTHLHTEQQLLSRLKQGDERAFTELYRMHGERLYLNLLRLLKSSTLAEELLQEIFVLFWEKRDSITVNTSFSAYLQRTAENKVVDLFRKMRRDQKLYAQLKATATEEQEETKETIQGQEQAALLKKALEILPPQRKQVFIACKLEGRSYNEVGELLGISPSTVNDHIVKATRTIRQFIQDHKELPGFLSLLLMGMVGSHF